MREEIYNKLGIDINNFEKDFTRLNTEGKITQRFILEILIIILKKLDEITKGNTNK